MFDAKSIIDMLTRGAGQPQSQAAGGGLADILGQLGQAMGQGGNPQGQPQGQGSLGDLLRNMVPSEGAPGRQQQGGGLEDLLRNILPNQSGPQSAAPQDQPSGGQGPGGLGDILGRLQEQLGGRQGGQPGQGGGLMDILGQVLGQATQGVKEGAQRVDEATGASGHARDALGRATGQTPEDILRKVQEWVAENKVAAGVGAGSLGAIVLGTKTGRSLAGGAAKLGGLALIAGLAYKALQNYQAGRPLLTGGEKADIVEAPRGSGFETNAISNDAATVYLRGMIAAAAADGRIDAKEHAQLLGGLKQMGLDAEAEEFLANELNNPATVEALVAGVSTQEQAVQLFTAARVAIDLDSQEEHEFLVSLANGLNLEPQLVQHIDATARAATN